MSELILQQAEELIKANSISCPVAHPGYLNDFLKSTVLYMETTNHLRANQMIAKNLESIQKIYTVHGQTFLYLPHLLRDEMEVFRYLYPGLPLNQSVTQENITSAITAKLLGELGVSSEIQEPMLLTFSNDNGSHSSGWVLTRIRGKISVEQFFQTHARVYTYYDFSDHVKYSTVLDGNFYESGSTDPESRFDTEVNRIVSEIDERIRFLKEKGLYRLLSDTIAPMLTPKLSSLCITEDYRIFLPDYDNLEITMNPLSKVVYFLFLRHPEGIDIKRLNLYKDELTQIYRLISNRESLTDMNESISKLTDPNDNSFYEKCSRIKRVFIEHFSNDLAHHYYIDGYPKQPKRILLSCDMISLPHALENIKTTLSKEDCIVMNAAEMFRNMGFR